MINFKIKIVNKVIDVTAFNESTKRYCKDFLCDEKADYFITLSEQDLKNEVINTNNGHVYVNEEISALYRKIADMFVEEGIIVFHGSSFMVNEHAFIITARSGVGKSTHSSLLNEYLKDAFIYINDDKPLLKVEDDKVIVFSNPWNGKERRGNNNFAPLSAIIFLNRGLENTYRKIDNKQEIYVKLISQAYLPKDKEKREKALKIVDIIFKRINFYEINVTKDIESAKMTYERIIKNEIE